MLFGLIVVLFRDRGKKTKYWDESSQENGKTFFNHSGDPPGDPPALTEGKPSFFYPLPL